MHNFDNPQGGEVLKKESKLDSRERTKKKEGHLWTFLTSYTTDKGVGKVHNWPRLLYIYMGPGPILTVGTFMLNVNTFTQHFQLGHLTLRTHVSSVSLLADWMCEVRFDNFQNKNQNYVKVSYSVLITHPPLLFVWQPNYYLFKVIFDCRIKKILMTILFLYLVLL